MLLQISTKCNETAVMASTTYKWESTLEGQLSLPVNSSLWGDGNDHACSRSLLCIFVVNYPWLYRLRENCSEFLKKTNPKLSTYFVFDARAIRWLNDKSHNREHSLMKSYGWKEATKTECNGKNLLLALISRPGLGSFSCRKSEGEPSWIGFLWDLGQWKVDSHYCKLLRMQS